MEIFAQLSKEDVIQIKDELHEIKNRLQEDMKELPEQAQNLQYMNEIAEIILEKITSIKDPSKVSSKDEIFIFAHLQYFYGLFDAFYDLDDEYDDEMDFEDEDLEDEDLEIEADSKE